MHLKLPSLPVLAVIAICAIVLFVLLHGEDVAQKPLENVGVTVNTNIDFVVVRDFLQALVEVFHVLDEQTSREVEVSLIIL